MDARPRVWITVVSYNTDRKLRLFVRRLLEVYRQNRWEHTAPLRTGVCIGTLADTTTSTSHYPMKASQS